MAERKKQGESKRLNQDEIIEALVPDPAQVPDVQMLMGFLGAAAAEGRWRLYLTPELSDYVEFCAEDVLHYQRVDSSESSLGGTAVWLRRGAELKHTRTTAAQAQAEFLQGDITQGYLGAAPGAAGQMLPGAGLAGNQRLAFTWWGCWTWWGTCRWCTWGWCTWGWCTWTWTPRCWVAQG